MFLLYCVLSSVNNILGEQFWHMGWKIQTVPLAFFNDCLGWFKMNTELTSQVSPLFAVWGITAPTTVVTENAIQIQEGFHGRNSL